MKKKAERILADLREIERAAQEVVQEAPGFALAARKIGTAADIAENWVRTAPDEKSVEPPFKQQQQQQKPAAR